MKLFFWCVNLLSFYWGIAYDNLKFFSCSKLCINRNKPSNACWKKYILSKEIPNSGTWVYIGWLSTGCSSYWQLILLFFCTFLSPFLSSLKRSTFLQILAIRFIFELLSVFFKKKKKPPKAWYWMCLAVWLMLPPTNRNDEPQQVLRKVTLVLQVALEDNSPVHEGALTKMQMTSVIPVMCCVWIQSHVVMTI